MNDIKVSIIVPVYNVEKYIDRCLNSLVNQTLKDIEIIIVNDNTPDNSMKICEEYASKDDRIKIYNKDYNEGLGYTRNYGIKRAKGEYIAFVDSDDYVDKDFYEKLYNEIVETNTDICFGEYKKVVNNEENEIITSHTPIEKHIESTKKIWNNMRVLNNGKKKSINCFIEGTVWQCLYKKSIIDNNNIIFVTERKYYAEDLVFNLDFLMNSNNASFVRGTYYYYCYNEQSLTHCYVTDRLKKAKLLKNKLMSQIVKYEVLEYEEAVKNCFLGQVRMSIRQEINREESLKNKIITIKEIVNDNDVITALKNKKEDDFGKAVFNFLIKTKQVTMLIIIYKLQKRLKEIKN